MTADDTTDPAQVAIDKAVEAVAAKRYERAPGAPRRWEVYVIEQPGRAKVHRDDARADILAALPALNEGHAAAIQAERADGSAVGDATFNEGVQRAANRALAFGSEISR